ncbi:MAG: hypothetical protein PGN13_11270 [Patulibacter minatonensis]
MERRDANGWKELGDARGANGSNGAAATRPERRSDVALIGSIAAGQSRLVRRDQLLKAGLTRHQIQRHRETGLLTRVLPGQYVVGVPTLSHAELLTAALLHCGTTSQLSHRTAGEVGGLLYERPGKVVVSTPRAGKGGLLETEIPVTETGQPGELRVCAASDLPDPFHVGGLRISPVPRAMIDIAGGKDGALVLGWAWREAEYRGLLDVDAIASEVASSSRRGVHLVGEVLRRHQVITTPETELRSRKELDFLRYIAAHGLPRPEVNVQVQLGRRRFRPDFLWRVLGLALEFDGPGHLAPATRDRDLRNDAEAFVADLDVLRFTTSSALADPVRHIALLRGAMERSARRLGIALHSLPTFD